MIYRPLLDAFAMAIGYGLMLLTGISAAIFLVAIAVDWQWRKVKDIYSWPWLMAAIKEYKKTHPRWQKAKDEDD